jgi:hypothetical protein
MSIIKVNAIQHTTANSGNMILHANGNVSMLTANSTLFIGNTSISNAGISVSGSAVSAFGGMRNRLINGDMKMDQRNAGATVTVTGSFNSVDRWLASEDSDAVVTIKQSTTVPTGYGFSNSVLMTVTTADTSIGAAQYCYIRQSIEGQNLADLMWGTSDAKPITISFWVRSSLTGTYCMTVCNSLEDRIYPSEYTINSANTWEQKIITVPGDTTGTWYKDIQAGLRLEFWHAIGSTYNGGINNTWNGANKYCTTNQVNWLATVGNTWYLTGVQLEIGSVATPYEFRQFTQELHLCQRYYWQSETISFFCAAGAGQMHSQVDFPVRMRVAPTVTYYPSVADMYARTNAGYALRDGVGNVSVGGVNNGNDLDSCYYTVSQANNLRVARTCSADM